MLRGVQAYPFAPCARVILEDTLIPPFAYVREYVWVIVIVEYDNVMKQFIWNLFQRDL